MTYQQQLSPWVIHQLQPDLTQSVVSRFRRRNEAEAYLKTIQRIRPTLNFAITFETAVSGAVEQGVESLAVNPLV
jgi:hypothetical protein